MELNYVLVGIVLLAVILLISWLIRRNRKDEKIVEHDMNLSDMKPDEHNEDEPDPKI